MKLQFENIESFVILFLLFFGKITPNLIKFMKTSMFLMKLIFQNEAKHLTQKFVN